jgi:hypothetical protein
MKIECMRTRLSDDERRGTDFADALRWVLAHRHLAEDEAESFRAFLAGETNQVCIAGSGHAFEFTRRFPALAFPLSECSGNLSGVTISGQRELVPTGHLMAFTGLVGQLRVVGFYLVADGTGLRVFEDRAATTEAAAWLKGIALTACGAKDLADLGQLLAEYCVESKG